MSVRKNKVAPNVPATALPLHSLSANARDNSNIKILGKTKVGAFSRRALLGEILKATPHLLKFPTGKMWIDYDKEADVLYISFKRPQKATDSQMQKKGVLHRYRGNELVGVTILEASQR